MNARRVRVLLGMLAAATVLAGCASIPTSGPVRPGQDVAVGVEEPFVRVLAPPPRPGATPEDVVRGFLIASATFEGDHSQARLYLSPTVRERWRPETGVRIYDSDSFRLEADGAAVLVHIRQLATIDREGRYLPLATPTETTATFRVAEVDGEWRVDALDDGLLLTTFDVRRAYRDVAVYFLDPDRSIVVPDLLMLPERPNLATVLTNRLLRGPSSWLAPAVDTAFPVGTALDVASVPVVNGVAEVDLNEVAFTAGPGDRQAMAAQLTWTLRQLPRVRFVRMTVNGREFSVPGVSFEQSRDSWPNFDPGGLASGVRAYAVRDGRLGSLDGEEFQPVAGPAGDGRLPLTDPAVSLPGDLVAGLSADRTTLFRGPLAEDAEVPAVLSGGDLAGPSWDPTGNLWTVDRAVGTGAVQVVMPDATTASVLLDDVGPGLVTSLRVARDGTRALVLARRPDGREELLLGTVVRGEDGRVPTRVTGLTSFAPWLVEVLDMAWLDAARVVVVAAEAGAPPVTLSLDVTGYASTPTGEIDAVDVAAAPGALPTIAATEAGELFQLASRSWLPLGPGSSPTYPG